MSETRGVAFCIATLIVVLAACEKRPNADHSSNGSPAGSNDVNVVTLSPHLAELVFAADAGDTLVGVSAYTDFPSAARGLPIVSDAFMVDHEQLMLLHPDIVLAWQNGTPLHVVDQLRAAGFRVEVIKTDSIDDVATALERIGELTGRQRQAGLAASRYRHQVRELADRFAGAASIEVFYQISSRPLYTVNGRHYVSELLHLCGGHNVFDDLGELAPMIDVEAVISRDPEAMLAASDSTQAAFDVWDRWPELAANRYENRFFVPADEIGRATPRLVDAGNSICEALEKARVNRQAYAKAYRR